MSRPTGSTWAGAALLVLALLAPPGCGSKISEANYYKVQYGMSEDNVEDLLGPAHAEVHEGPPTTAATRPVDRKTKTWSRGGLKLSVVFEDGKVVARSAEGIAGEGGAVIRPTTTPATLPQSPPHS